VLAQLAPRGQAHFAAALEQASANAEVHDGGSVPFAVTIPDLGPSGQPRSAEAGFPC